MWCVLTSTATQCQENSYAMPVLWLRGMCLPARHGVERELSCGSSTPWLCNTYFRPCVSETNRSRAVLLRPCVITALVAHGAEKRSSTGAIITAFVDIKDVKPGQTVSVHGKVLSKSGTMTFGDMLWNCGVFQERGWESLQKRASHMFFFVMCPAESFFCMLFSRTDQGPPDLELCGHGSMCRTARREICFD